MTAPALQPYVQGQGVVSADNLNTFEQTCDNPPQLRAITGVAGMQVFMRGNVTPGDGGQGTFYWNAAGTAPDDNGVTTILPTGSVIGEWTRIPNAVANAIGGTVVTAGAIFSVPNLTQYVGVNKATGSPTTLLLSAAPLPFEYHILKDSKGDAATNNITVSGNGKTIDGALTFVMSIARESIGVIYDGTQWNVV